MDQDVSKSADFSKGDAIISRHSVVAVARDQVSCDLDGEAVILNMRSGVYYGLNALGSTVWNLIQEPTTVERIEEALLGEYDVEPERCERDLLALLQDMAAAGIVEVKMQSSG